MLSNPIAVRSACRSLPPRYASDSGKRIISGPGGAMHTRILILAGEASGDQHGAELVRAMRRLDPQVEWFGLGGAQLEREGVKLLYRIEDLGVVGFTEVIRKLPLVRRVLRHLRRIIRDEPPDLVVPIDYPDFNLRVARYARECGIPVIYYISPQVWAWRRKRVRKIRRFVDHMMVLFPFEVDYYRSEGVPVTYVGHPVVDAFEPFRDRIPPIASQDQRILLLPGSRMSEVNRHLGTLLDAARELHRRNPRLRFELIRAESLPQDIFDHTLADQNLPLRIVRAPILEAVPGCLLAITASGTATLEIAMTGTPMIVVYRVSALTYLLARTLVRTEHIALVNIVAGRRLVPELIQDQFSPLNVVEQATALLENPERRVLIQKELLEVRKRLGAAGASERAAELVYRYLCANRLPRIP